MKIHEVLESASGGATGSGNIATVANPMQAKSKVKTDKNGIQKHHKY